MSKGTLLALALLAAVLSGCQAEPASIDAVPIRLTEGISGVTVEWPQPERKVPKKFLATHIGTIPAPGRVARLVLHRGKGERDGRIALLAPVGSHYRFPVTIPRGVPSLEVALGHGLDPLEEGLDLRFRIDLVDRRGAAHALLDETITTRQGAAWQDRRLSLSPWQGEAATLNFSVEGPANGALWPAWGIPEINDDVASSESFDLILIVLDTLRADHLGAYGYQRPTSPFLDRWGEEGTRFEVAISQSSWTRPSHRSLFSGLYPTSRNGLVSPPLAEVLWRAGYRTSALTGGAQLDFRFGFSRGFEVQRIERWVRSVDRVMDELERNRRRKSFLFLQTYEIHDPYRHNELAEGLDPGRVGKVFKRATLEAHGRDLTAGEKEYVTALYDSGILYVDRQLERLFSQLQTRGLLESTVVVVTSDHGEELWDHGRWGHGHAMFDHQTRVPLWIHLPAALRSARGLEPAQGRVVRQQVRLIDLYPTLLDLVGIPLEHRVQGRSLVPLLAGGRLPSGDALSESTYWGPLEFKTLRSERFKYMMAEPKKVDSERSGWATLFDLDSDPKETQDVAADEPEIFDRMKSLMEILLSDGEAAEETVPADLDPELKKQLQALGYLGG